MTAFSADIVGLKELEAKLLTLKQQTVKTIIWEALDAGAQVFHAAVQEAAPERPDLPSGRALPAGALAADIVRYRGRDDQGDPAMIVGPGKGNLRGRSCELSRRTRKEILHGTVSGRNQSQRFDGVLHRAQWDEVEVIR